MSNGYKNSGRVWVQLAQLHVVMREKYIEKYIAIGWDASP